MKNHGIKRGFFDTFFKKRQQLSSFQTIIYKASPKILAVVILPNKKREEGIHLGGNVSQTWRWTETYNVKQVEQ